MPVNALRKKGAKMSLSEAQERIEKLRNLSQSSNHHEAALAQERLRAFDVETARYPKPEIRATSAPGSDPHQVATETIETLDDPPDQDYHDLGILEIVQPAETKKVDWEWMHAELRERAKQMGADAIMDIHLRGTVSRRILAATALRYLTPVELAEQALATKLDDDERAYHEEQKERRDEANAPPID